MSHADMKKGQGGEEKVFKLIQIVGKVFFLLLTFPSSFPNYLFLLFFSPTHIFLPLLVSMFSCLSEHCSSDLTTRLSIPQAGKFEVDTIFD